MEEDSDDEEESDEDDEAEKLTEAEAGLQSLLEFASSFHVCSGWRPKGLTDPNILLHAPLMRIYDING